MCRWGEACGLRAVYGACDCVLSLSRLRRRAMGDKAGESDEEEKGFMDKMKAKAKEIQEGLGPAMENAKVKAGEFKTKVQEKYEELKAEAGPKLLKAKESVDTAIDGIKVREEATSLFLSRAVC